MGLLRRSSNSNPEKKSQDPGALRDAGRSTTRRRRRLLIESLGQRRVLAVITGTVFQDSDASLRQEPGEVAAPSRLVYVDTNQNATLDPGEATAISDEAGQFRIEGLEDGLYPVRLFDGSTSQAQIFPAEVTERELQVQVNHSVDIGYEGGALFVLTDQSMLRTQPAGISAAEYPLELTPTEIVASGIGVSQDTTVFRGLDQSSTDSKPGVWISRGEQSSLTELGEDLQIDQIALGSDGNGVLLTPHASSLQIQSVSIDSSGNESGPAVHISPTGVTVPSDAQILSSTSGTTGNDPLSSRTVFAWTGPTNGARSSADGSSALTLSLWSNTTSSWIEDSFAQISDAVSLVSFDDEMGLVAVRYSGGGIGVLDVNSGFSSLHDFDTLSGLVTFIPGQEALASVAPTENGYAFSIHDLRGGGTLAHRLLDLPNAGAPVAITADSTLDSVVILGQTGIVNLRLDRPAAHHVSVTDNQDITGINFGIRVEGDNQPPDVTDQLTLDVAEDDTVELSAFELANIASDADGDVIVPIVSSAPSNGSIVVQAGGGIVYQPDENYSGPDTFAIQFHDGQSTSAPISMRVTVSPRPDAPTGMVLDNASLPENVAGPYRIGALSVQDPDDDGHYAFSVADSRFDVIGNELFFDWDDNVLNYEDEYEIFLDIFAYNASTDELIGEQFVVHVLDVNDPIEAILPGDVYVNENEAGIEVAALGVYDEDGPTVTFSVDDDRFEIVEGDHLKLKDDVAFNFEIEDVVVVTITANDGAGSSHSSELTIHVQDIVETNPELVLTRQTVVELEPGAEVGDVFVNSGDPNAQYELSVNDNRFEIDGSTLKLHDDRWLLRSDAEQIELTLTAQHPTDTSQSLSETYVIDVLENSSPFHNDATPEDVDGNAVVSPADALAVINYLNVYSPGPVGPGDPGFGYDVNGDGMVSALDALLVINYLNVIHNGGGTVGGEPSEEDKPVGDVQSEPTSQPAEPEATGEGEQVTPPPSSDIINPSVSASPPSGAIEPVNDAPIEPDPESGPRSYYETGSESTEHDTVGYPSPPSSYESSQSSAPFNRQGLSAEGELGQDDWGSTDL